MAKRRKVSDIANQRGTSVDDVLAHQLHQVLVGTNDQCLVAELATLRDRGCEQVVGLDSF